MGKSPAYDKKIILDTDMMLLGLPYLALLSSKNVLSPLPELFRTYSKVHPSV